MTVFINYKKVLPEAVSPHKTTDGACGYDLTAATHRGNHHYIEYDTGIAVEIPKGYVGLVFPRSSVSNKGWMLANSVGVIDQDYRGTIKLRFSQVDPEAKRKPYSPGDRIGQLVVVPCFSSKIQEVTELSETERDEGGFGSTGA